MLNTIQFVHLSVRHTGEPRVKDSRHWIICFTQ